MGELHDIQNSFTKHLRNPDHVPIPDGLDKRRVEIYSGLIFNNLSSLLSDFFPVIKLILSLQQWDRMVRDFFIKHESKTPYFMEISGEFARYLSHSKLPPDYPDFLPELAHYEWVELALYTMDEDHPDSLAETDQLIDQPLSLSPLARPIAYQYPVHNIKPEYQPQEPGPEPTLLLLLRDLNESVRFFELQPLAFHLLKQIEENPGFIARNWLNEYANQIGARDKLGFIKRGLNLMQFFNEHRIFVCS